MFEFITPMYVFLIFAGTLVGIIFGAIPGMTATMAVAVCLPLTYSLGLDNGLALLLGLYVGGISGGLVPAILLGIPGTHPRSPHASMAIPWRNAARAKRACASASWPRLSVG